MTLKIIGAGIGRTGTFSLTAALNLLGLGPTYHMTEVMAHMPVQLPLWQNALKGKLDWATVYKGYASAVDWPTAAFTSELYKAYPDAKFILTVRSPESWAASFSETIYALCAAKDQAPPHMRDWLDMAIGVIGKSGFPPGLNLAQLAKAFTAHNEAVKAVIPAKNLLIYEVAQGWEPLCKFVGKSVPGEAFPKTNDRAGFWELVKAGSKAA